jgi:uncharacterized protein
MNTIDLVNKYNGTVNFEKFKAQLKEQKQSDLNFAESDGTTALHYACLYRLDEAIGLMVDAGCALNVVSSSLGTPLMMSISSGLDEIFDLFLQKGADPDLVNSSNENAIMAAVRYKNRRALFALIYMGANLNQINIEGNNALHLAYLMKAGQEFVDMLLQHGINKNLKNNHGLIPENLR